MVDKLNDHPETDLYVCGVGDTMERMQSEPRKSLGSGRTLTWGRILLAWHVLGVSAFAQRPGVLPNEDASFMPWIIAVGAVIVMALPAFRNPKRSHLS